MANAAKQARLERAKRLAEDPERAERLKARDEIVAARGRRIAEREAERRAAQERDAAELAAKEAAEAAARDAERRDREEAEAKRLAEQAKREAGSGRTGGNPRSPSSGPEKEEAERALEI